MRNQSELKAAIDNGRFSLKQRNFSQKHLDKERQDHERVLRQNNAFGKAMRTQTPVKGILHGDYGNQAEQEIKNAYDVEADARYEKLKKLM